MCNQPSLIAKALKTKGAHEQLRLCESGVETGGGRRRIMVLLICTIALSKNLCNLYSLFLALLSVLFSVIEEESGV